MASQDMIFRFLGVDAGAGAQFEHMHGAVAKLGAGVAVAAAAFVADSVKMALTFQTTATSLAQSAGISQGAAVAMGDSFKNVSNDFSAQKLTAAYGQVAAQLGVVQGRALSVAQADQVMTAASDLAESSGADLTTTTAALAATMTAFHQPARNAADVADQLLNTSRALNLPVSDVSTAVDKLKGRLGALAPSLSDVGTLMLEMGEHGITGSRGVMLVNTGLQTLIGGSKATKTELAALGVRVFDASGHFVGMQSVITQLQPKLAKLTQQQQELALKTLFGSGAAQAMGQVIASGTGAFDRASAAVSKTGTAQAGAAAQASTLQGRTENLHRQITNITLTVGERLVPALADVAGWMGRNVPIVEALAAVIGGVLVAAVMAWAVGVVTSAATSAAAFATMIAEAVTWAATTIAAAGSVLIAWIAAMAPMLATAIATAVGILIAFAPLILTLGAIGLAAYELYAHWSTVWGAIKAFSVEAWDFLKSHIELLVLAVSGVGLAAYELYKHWATVWGAIKAVAADAWHVLRDDVLRPIIAVGLAPVRAAVDVLRVAWTVAWGAIQAVVSAAWSAIKGVFNAGVKAMEDVIKLFRDLITGKWGKLWTDAKKLVSDAFALIKKVFTDFAGEALKLLYQAGKDIIQGLVNGIKDMAGAAENAVKDVGKGLVHGVTSLLGIHSPSTVMYAIGENVVQGLVDGMHDRVAKVSAVAAEVAAAIAAKIAPTPTNTASLLADYTGSRGSAVSAQGTANVADAHAAELTEHYTALAAQLKALKTADAAAVAAARQHADAMRQQALAALRAAEALPHATKAERAVRDAAIASARSMEDEAAAAMDRARKLAALDAKREAALAKTVASAKTASDAAKQAAATADQAAKDAANAAAQAAQTLIAQIQSQATALEQQITSFQSTVKNGLTSGFSFSSLWSGLTSGGGTASLSGFTDSLAQTLSGVTSFASDLQALAKAGASQDVISQILGMGVSSGDSLAQQLLAAGSGQISSLNDTLSSITQVSTQAADALSGSFYGPAVQGMQTFIAGLESQFPELTAALTAISSQVQSVLGPSALPLASPPTGTTGSSYAQPSVVVHVTNTIDGKAVATVVTPAVRTELLRTKARVGTLGLT